MTNGPYRRPLVIALHLALFAAANYCAFELRFDGQQPAWALRAWWQMLPWLVVTRGVTFAPFRLYEGLWRYTSIYDLRALLAAVAVSSAVFGAITMSPLGPPVYPRSVLVMDALLTIVGLGGVRLMRRFYRELSTGKAGRRIVVYGAGAAGELVVRNMKANPEHGYQPVGFVDDDTAKVGRRIHGIPVLGSRHHLSRVLARYKPHEVLIAIPSAGAAQIRGIVRALEPFTVPIKTLPALRDGINGRVGIADIRSLAVEDLLSRAPVGLDSHPLKQLIVGRRVMVTGAGGSIGSELCRQIATLEPAALIMLDRYENGLHAIRLELDDRRPSCGVHPVVGDITDAQRVSAVLQQYRPDIIFHAAAHKHVPLMEENPCEAIKNNVRGTRILAELAEAHGVDRFVFISTDKAVNPTNVMGASKRLAELVLQAQAVGSGTSFATVRFGNVLGSNGSVIPRFVEQIRNGGPVTVTHPEMRRFFMLIPEAVQLVLHAAAQAEDGVTYVLEMGEQVKLVDMARSLIRLSGGIADEDIAIAFIGLRPGEKLYEELVGGDETLGPSAVDKVLRVTGRTKPTAEMLAGIAHIEEHAVRGGTQAVLEGIRGLMPEFGPAHHLPGGAAVDAEAVEASLEDEESAFVIEQFCPRCQSSRVRRSRPRSFLERARRRVRANRLFKCPDCHWRGWLIPLEFSGGTLLVPPVDLAALDERVESGPAPGRRSVVPRDLVN
jgi:FlaA1/EpsC-like NDP-sugar epimerase